MSKIETNKNITKQPLTKVRNLGGFYENTQVVRQTGNSGESPMNSKGTTKISVSPTPQTSLS